MGIKFQFCKMKRLLEMDGVNGHTTIKCLQYHWTVQLNMTKRVNYILYIFYHNKNKFLKRQITKNKKQNKIGYLCEVVFSNKDGKKRQ